MQDVDRVGQLRHVDHAEGAGVIPYPDLPDACTDGGHRLPVVRLLSALYLVDLEARILAGAVRERAQGIEGVAQELDRLHRHGWEYTITCKYRATGATSETPAEAGAIARSRPPTASLSTKPR